MIVMRVQRLLALLAFVPALFSQSASSQEIATFQYPIGNETYNILDTVIVQWTSNYVNPILFTWVGDTILDNGELVSEINSVPQSGNFSYSLKSYSNAISTYSPFPAVVWFDLIYDLSIAAHLGGYNGEAFNVTSNPAAIPTTWALGTSYVSLSPTSTSSKPTSASGTASATTSAYPAPVTSPPASTSPTANGLSIGGKVGIGIGSVALALFVVAGIAWFVISRRWIRNLENRLSGAPPEHKHEMAADQKPQTYHQVQLQNLDVELPGRSYYGAGGYGSQVPTNSDHGGNGRFELGTNGR